MASTRFIQNNFNAGELSPRLTAREDFERYSNGVAEMVNFLALPQGGATTRPGFQWVAQTKDGGKAYLIPFEFSTTQAYIIEAGHQYFRFFKDDGRIYDASGTITGITQNGAGEIRITSTAHGLSSGHYVEILGVTGTVEANGEWVVTVVNANTFDLQGSVFTNAYTGGGTWNRPYQIATPYALADLPTLRYAQTADVLYLVHPSYRPRKLTRTGHTAWTLSTFTLLNGPYMPENTTSTTLTPSVTTGNGTLTASSAIFTPDHVGAYFRLLHGTTWGYVEVTGYNSPTSVNMTVKSTLGGTTPTPAWREGSFSTHRGWPSAVAFIEQRLVYASTPSEPQTLWLSTTGSYDDFTPTAPSGTVNSDHALTYRIGAGTGRANVIRWLTGGRKLIVGTMGEEFVLDGGQTALTPTTPPVARAYTSYGSAPIQGLKVGQQTFYVQRAGRKLRGFGFDFSTDSYLSPDFTILVDHLFRSASISRASYQQEPYSILWVVRSDGALLSFTYDELHKVMGWARHGTDGEFVDVASIPAPDAVGDTLWAIVKRTVGGVDRHYVEFANPSISTDAAVVYNGTVKTASLTPGATSGTGVTFTASASVFSSSDVGRSLVVLGYTEGGTKWYSRATITTYLSPTQVQADILTPFPPGLSIPAGFWGIGRTRVTVPYHLKGRTVQVVGDNAVYDPVVVPPSGEVILRYGDAEGPAAVNIQVGLAFTPVPRILTLQPAYRDQGGVVRGKFKHWVEVFVALENTLGLTINKKTRIQYRTPADPMDQGPPLFTGEKRVSNLGWSRSGQLIFEQELPLPATLLSYYGELDIGD